METRLGGVSRIITVGLAYYLRPTSANGLTEKDTDPNGLYSAIYTTHLCCPASFILLLTLSLCPLLDSAFPSGLPIASSFFLSPSSTLPSSSLPAITSIPMLLVLLLYASSKLPLLPETDDGGSDGEA
jgi:hypothetical protein